MASAKEATVSLEGSLKELNLTNEEMNKFEKAFKDPEFLKLFEEYAKEVSDPKAKAETELYLRQLEQQGRGEDVYGKGVQLVVPAAAMVLKSKVTSASGSGGGEDSLPVGQKVFINICTSEKVEKYTLKDAKDASGRAGKQLSIPLTLGPKRIGTDKHGQPAAVYDFVVHPASVEFATGHAAAMSTLAETALEQVEKVGRCSLSRSWRRLNIRFKATEGCTEPPVQTIRTGEGGEAVGGRLRPRPDVPAVDVPGAKSAAAAGDAAATAVDAASAGGQAAGKAPGTGKRSAFSFDRPKGAAKAPAAPEIKDPAQPGYRHADGSVTPEWSLLHRGEADLAAAWGDAGRGLALTAPSVPKELVVRVTLPGVDSAAAVDLDVGAKLLTLKVPARYQLAAPLPYNVDESKGKAKFDKARKQIEITLPVIPPPLPPLPRAVPPAAPAAPEPLEQRGLEEQGQAQVSQQQEGEQPGTRRVPSGSDREAASVGGAEGRVAEDAGVEARVQEAGTCGLSSVAGEDGASQAVGWAALEGGSGGKGADWAGEDVAGGGAVEGAEQLEPAVGGNSSGGVAASGGMSEADGRQLTENERRWREIHARQEQASGPDGEEKADGAAVDGAGPAGGEAPALAEPAAASAAAEGVVEPATVVLRPRLKSDLAMELD